MEFSITFKSETIKGLGIRTYIIVFIILIGFRVSHAQDRTTISDWKTKPNIITKSFDQNDGLPVVSLSDIEFGADNHLYVASYSGLSRFDGTDFELITSEQFPQLRSNRILRILAAPDSSIWMFDDQYNISRWKAGEITVYDTLNGTGDRVWSEFKISGDGSIWAINRYELRILENIKDAAWQLKKPLPFLVKDFVPISSSKAWLVNEDGLYFYTNGSIEPVNLPKGLPSLSSEEEIQLQLLSNGKILVYNYAFIYVFDPKSNSSEAFSLDHSDDVEATAKITIYEREPNLLFISTYDSFYELDLKRSTLKKTMGMDGIRVDYAEFNPLWNNERLYVSYDRIDYLDHIIYSVATDLRIVQTLQDKEQNLWVSSSSQGLKRLTKNPFQLLNESNGLGGLNTYSIIEENDSTVWVASYNSGVNRIGDNNIDFWFGPNLPNGRTLVRSLFKQRNGNILAGVWDNGLKRYDGNSWSEVPLIDSSNNAILKTVEAYYEEPDGTLWMGGRESLIKKEVNDTYFERVLTDDGSALSMVQVIQADKQDRVWFGSNGDGLHVMREGIIQKVPFLDDDVKVSIRDIFTERRDTLWLATQNYGLIRAILDKEGNVLSHKSLTKADGLPDIGVHRILADAYGYFWLPSNQGLSRVNENELNRFLDGPGSPLWVQTFTEDDGLPIREGNGGTQSSGMVASDSTIWIPTQRGVIRFDPTDFLDKNPYQHTKISVSSIETESQRYTLFGRNEVELNVSERSPTLSFSVLHFTNPQNIGLEYRIKSLDIGWKQLTSDRRLNFTRIPSGKHSIELRIAGVPNHIFALQSFTLVIPPYIYETTLFLLVVFFGIISFIAFGFKLVIRAANKRENILNEKVEERTLQLQEQTVELERLNQVKTDFFINITHELRTPLSLIKGPLGLLKEVSHKTGINQELQLDLIERNSERLSNLVDRLLNLLRLETEQDSETIQKIDLRKFVSHNASQFESSKELEEKQFDIHLQGMNTFVYADPHTLELIINNLISNAIKYTRKGDTISVNVFPSDENIVFEIVDSGIGIAQEDLQFVFDPFYRAGNASELQGSGVGLSIVKRYMDRIGGRITITSKKEIGTKVRLVFPSEHTTDDPISTFKIVEQKSIEREPKQALPTPNLGIDDSPSNKQKLLIVDDNPDLRLFFSELLGSRYDVKTAINGEDGLKILEQYTPDLIISDVMMPVMNGISFTKNIRLRKELEMVPFILLSAKTNSESITEGLDAGAHVYLTKPVENSILLAQIDTLLARETKLSAIANSLEQEALSGDQIFFNQIHALVLRHLSDPNLSVDAIANYLNISRSTLYRKWKTVHDKNLNDFIIKTRIDEATSLIKEKEYSFSEASRVCGFVKAGYFSTSFKKHYGVTPSEYFKGKNSPLVER